MFKHDRQKQIDRKRKVANLENVSWFWSFNTEKCLFVEVPFLEPTEGT